MGKVRSVPRAWIVGVGPGASDLLTDRARAVVAESDAILAWELNLRPLAGTIAGKRLFVQHPDDYEAVAAEAADEVRRTNGTLAVVRIGDALVSSGLTALLALLHDFEVRVVPGIGSAQLAAAAAAVNLDETVLFSFHEERRWEDERDFLHESFRRGRHVVVLTGPTQPPEATARYLIQRGVDPTTRALVGENLSLTDERIVRGSLEEIAAQTFHWLSVLLVVHPIGINPLWRGRDLAASSER